MIEIGSLVRDTLNGGLGIVTGYQMSVGYIGEKYVLVRFLTGYWEGQTDPCSPDSLEEVK